MQPSVRTVIIGLRSVSQSRGTLTLPPNFRTMPTVFASFQTKRMPRETSMAEKQLDKFMIVGLGNHDLPKTRHSVGMQVVDRLADCLDARFSVQKTCAGCVATACTNGVDLVLLKPKMPMNVNGTSVSKTAQFFNIPAENVYLLHDDIEKGLGNLTVKEKGSANGHNGVRSVLNSLRTDMVTRIRIGIDRPPSKDEVAEYVLEKFPRQEQEVVDRVVDTCITSLAKHLGKRTGQDFKQALKKETNHTPDK